MVYLPSMSKWSELFGMTRRERRGTIVILALMALVMAGGAVFRHCAPRPRVEVMQADLERFEQQIDSMQQSTHPAGKPAKEPASTRKRHKQPSTSPKAPQRERRLDPVPQI